MSILIFKMYPQFVKTLFATFHLPSSFMVDISHIYLFLEIARCFASTFIILTSQAAEDWNSSNDLIGMIQP